MFEKIDVDVDIDPGVVRYDNGRSLIEVSRMAGLPTSVGARPARHAAGLTRSAYEQKFMVDVASVDVGGGWQCADIRKVWAHIRFTALDVFIAREYKPGSCAYTKVREHEDNHVKISREALMRHRPNFERALRRIVAQIGPIRARSGDEAANIAADRIEKRLQPVFSAFEKSLRESNAVFDSPAEYMRLHKSCSKW